MWGLALASPSIPIFLTNSAIFWFGAFNLRSAGCAINDILDQDFDKHVERTKNRPIASKVITPKEGVAFMLMHLSGGLFTL
jgi:4-hydroxybenzoate polyprenyltransferase